MSASAQADYLAPFFAGLRAKGFHLGLDPEFSAIQKLATAPLEKRGDTLRENIDQFVWARGFPVLEKIQQKAAEQGNAQVAQMLGSMREVINGLLKGQFMVTPEDRLLPQPQMLREMLRLVNETDADTVIAYVEKNIEYLDGNFFMSISESLRNIRGRAPDPNVDITVEVLIGLGRLVAEKRLERRLPCSFHALYGV
jgi:hypothetical protein